AFASFLVFDGRYWSDLISPSFYVKEMLKGLVFAAGYSIFIMLLLHGPLVEGYRATLTQTVVAMDWTPLFIPCLLCSLTVLKLVADFKSEYFANHTLPLRHASLWSEMKAF